MRRIWPAILLAWVAGFVDSLGYLALDKVFTAHMSGNSAAVGAELGKGNFHEALIRGMVIPGFILGLVAGALAGGLARRIHARSQLAPACLLEITLLACFLVLEPSPHGASSSAGNFGYFVLVWLLALAMGIQSATLRRAGGIRVHTTYISGMITNMTENGVVYISRMWRRYFGRPQPGRAAQSKAAGPRAAVFGSIFFAFLIGGICGGFGQARWGSFALFAPMLALLALLLRDWIVPLHQQRSSS